jgi:hypothetical protein
MVAYYDWMMDYLEKKLNIRPRARAIPPSRGDLDTMFSKYITKVNDGISQQGNRIALVGNSAMLAAMDGVTDTNATRHFFPKGRPQKLWKTAFSDICAFDELVRECAISKGVQIDKYDHLPGHMSHADIVAHVRAWYRSGEQSAPGSPISAPHPSTSAVP